MQQVVSILATGILTTVVLMTLGAVAGYWAGVRSVVPTIVAGPPIDAAWQYEQSELLKQLSQCIGSSELASEQCAALAALCQPEVQAQPAEILKAISNVIQATGGLTAQLHDLQSLARLSSKMQAAIKSELKKSAPIMASAAPQPQAAASLTTEQMSDVMGGRQNLGESTYGMETKRYPYNRRQRVAPLRDGEAAATFDQFVEVRCVDISVSGISFFWPEKPDFQRLVISIGVGDTLIFMEAEVSQHKAVCKHGEVLFQVNCRYLRRLDELTAQWHAAVEHALVS